jgi:uncharacterized protein (TIGR02271 family)
MDDDREQLPADENREIVIPIVEEEIVTGARPVKTGSVRVDKRVEKHVRKIDMPLLHEEVEVKRVPVNRVVTVAPQVRTEGDTTIVPIVEEELVVTKRLLLKEEIHLTRRRTRNRYVRDVELQRETAEVRRLDSAGRTVEKTKRRNSVGWPTD